LKRTLAAVITALVFGTVLWLGRGDVPPSSTAGSGADTPELCIQRMFEAAAAGDVTAYVDCFSGRERDRLEQQLIGSRREQFARSLVDAVAGLRGRAVFADGPVGDDRARYAVDRVYESRTERQTYELVCEAGVWRIESVRMAQPFQPKTAYGTPVFEEPPPEDEDGDDRKR
jgi:hypothetical protein